MRLVSVKQAKHLLKKMCSGKSRYHSVKLLTAKKDRSIMLERFDHQLTMIEDGYEQQTNDYHLPDNECHHEVMASFKREFPRSRWTYVVTTV